MFDAMSTTAIRPPTPHSAEQGWEQPVERTGHHNSDRPRDKPSETPLRKYETVSFYSRHAVRQSRRRKLVVSFVGEKARDMMRRARTTRRAVTWSVLSTVVVSAVVFVFGSLTRDAALVTGMALVLLCGIGVVVTAGLDRRERGEFLRAIGGSGSGVSKTSAHEKASVVRSVAWCDVPDEQMPREDSLVVSPRVFDVGFLCVADDGHFSWLLRSSSHQMFELGSTVDPYSFASDTVAEVVEKSPRMQRELLTLAVLVQYGNDLAQTYRSAHSAADKDAVNDVVRTLAEVAFDITRIGSSVNCEMRNRLRATTS